MDKDLLGGSKNPKNLIRSIRYDLNFHVDHPDYFDLSGIYIFCGCQGSGKTLSGVQFCKKVCQAYPKAILVTNTEIKGLPESTQVIEYDGLDSLKSVENGYLGVIYFIDEIHLELNSLESQNIDMDVIVELSQQRKQRKMIIGTSQVYMRMAKPLREQVRNIIICKNYLKYFQWNKLIDGFNSYEENGKLIADVVGKFFWIHSPDLYDSYDTYKKMKRYKKEWKGRKQYAGWD